MLRAIGLEDELRWVQTQSGFYAGPEVGLRPFSNAVDFLRLPDAQPRRQGPAGRHDPRRRPAARRRDAWSRSRSRSGSRSGPADGRSSASGSRCCGPSWATSGAHASAAFIWATIQRLYAARRSGLKVEQFGYVQGGGYARIFDVLRAAPDRRRGQDQRRRGRAPGARRSRGRGRWPRAADGRRRGHVRQRRGDHGVHARRRPLPRAHGRRAGAAAGRPLHGRRLRVAAAAPRSCRRTT